MSDISRRGLIGGALALGGASLFPLSQARLGGTVATADSFFNSIGICTHPNWRRTVWERRDWEAPFGETGVVNLRGKIGSGPAAVAVLRRLRPLFDAGVRMCVTIAEQDGSAFDLKKTQASLDFLASHVGADNISGIESANEYNNPATRPADWVARLRHFQTWLHDSVRRNRAFDRVPLIAPSMWGRLTTDYRALGNLEPTVDRGNLHYYTGGRRPTRMGEPGQSSELGGGADSSLERAIADARTLSPRSRLWMSEFGYRVAGAGANHRGDLNERIAAKYLLRGLFDILAEGVEKTFIYTLIDDDHETPPAYHGLLDRSLRPRVAFHGLCNLMALFRDESSPRPSIAPDHSLAGATRAVRHHAFSRADGSKLVVLYQDVDSYDRRSRAALKVAPVAVRLDFAEPVRAEVFDPMVSATALRTGAPASRLTLAVGDSVTIVKISAMRPDRASSTSR
jgi:hypothetical protein